jgi:hypothetical protein
MSRGDPWERFMREFGGLEQDDEEEAEAEEARRMF